jgi:hypothetical protein
MLVDKYLIISAKKSRYGYPSPQVRMVEKEPTLDGNEISMRLKIDIPDAFFKRPRLEAVMKLPEELVPKTSLTPEITTNVEKIIKETTGLTMVVSIVDNAEKTDEKAS